MSDCVSPTNVGSMEGLGPNANNLTGDAAWLWTHCRALGMIKRSDSGLFRDDVALFVAELRGALRELVECKDLADRFDKVKQDVPDLATAAVLQGIQLSYQARKPNAWAAARVALGPNL